MIQQKRNIAVVNSTVKRVTIRALYRIYMLFPYRVSDYFYVLFLVNIFVSQNGEEDRRKGLTGIGMERNLEFCQLMLTRNNPSYLGNDACDCV